MQDVPEEAAQIGWDFRPQSSVMCWLHLPYKTTTTSCGPYPSITVASGCFEVTTMTFQAHLILSRKAEPLENSGFPGLTLTKSRGLG